MTRENQVKICLQCKNGKRDLEQGIICSLTGSIATFESECYKFKSIKLVNCPNCKHEIENHFLCPECGSTINSITAKINNDRYSVNTFYYSFLLILIAVGFSIIAYRSATKEIGRTSFIGGDGKMFLEVSTPFNYKEESDPVMGYLFGEKYKNIQSAISEDAQKYRSYTYFSALVAIISLISSVIMFIQSLKSKSTHITIVKFNNNMNELKLLISTNCFSKEEFSSKLSDTVDKFDKTTTNISDISYIINILNEQIKNGIITKFEFSKYINVLEKKLLEVEN